VTNFVTKMNAVYVMVNMLPIHKR